MPESEAERLHRLSVIERALDLPERDIWEVHRVLGEHLEAGGGRETKAERQSRLRGEALAALREAEKKLGLPEGRAPTIKQYRKKADKLGLEVSPQQIVRRWGSWREAQRALLGQHTQRTPEQQELRRKYRTDAHAEDPIFGLREWLKTKPPRKTTEAYTAWCDRVNPGRPTRERYSPAQTVLQTLTLSWDLALTVALKQMTLRRAQQKYLRELLANEGPLKLINMPAAALIVGKPSFKVEAAIKRGEFPVHVVRFSRQRAWYRPDIEAYAKKRPVPEREPEEFNDRVVSSRELAQLLGKSYEAIAGSTATRTRYLPDPAGYIGKEAYWVKSDAKRWARKNPDLLGHAPKTARRKAAARAREARRAKNSR